MDCGSVTKDIESRPILSFRFTLGMKQSSCRPIPIDCAILRETPFGEMRFVHSHAAHVNNTDPALVRALTLLENYASRAEFERHRGEGVFDEYKVP